MKRFVSFSFASVSLIYIFVALIFLHVSILAGILIFDFAPVDFLWGGKLENDEQLLRFEILSLSISLVCLFIILVTTRRIFLPKLEKLTKVLMWVIFFLFMFNTIGNLLAESLFEKFFAIVTVLISLLSLRIAIATGDRMI